MSTGVCFAVLKLIEIDYIITSQKHDADFWSGPINLSKHAIKMSFIQTMAFKYNFMSM